MLGFAVLLMGLVANAAACGTPAIAPWSDSAAIVGGYDAKEGSWPWQVQVRKLSFGGQWCGGTLIDDQWVLSAAHCFHTIIGNPDVTDYEFVLGAHHIDDEGEYYQKFTASKITLHENYGAASFTNDVALIKLNRPVTYSDGVTTACMRSSPPGAGTTAWVTGWGDQEKLVQSKYLQQVDVPIVSDSACDDAYPGSIDSTMICAGYWAGGKDACQGDSGGPLVFYDEGDKVWYLGGVVSWGEGCADRGKYGVYADVSKFQDWIATNKV